VTYATVSAEVKNRYKREGNAASYILSPQGVRAIPEGESEEIGYLRPLNPSEYSAVYDIDDGLIGDHCKLYKYKKKFAARACRKNGALVERLMDCYCGCLKCDYKFIICRTNGAMLLYEASTTLPDGEVVAVSHTGHNYFPSDAKDNLTSLSHAQKEFCIKKHKSNFGSHKLLAEMRLDKSIVFSPAQNEDCNREKLHKSIDNFIYKASNVSKYLSSRWQQQEMTSEMMNEVLEVLSRPYSNPGDRTLDNVPVSTTGCLMMESNGFKLMWIHLHVESVKRLEDGKLQVVLMTNSSVVIAEKSSEMFTIFAKPGVQAEMDFAEMNDGQSFGHIGISDYGKKLWSVGAVFTQDGTENTDNAHGLLEPLCSLFSRMNLRHMLMFVLSDGSKAIRAAIDRCHLLPKSCYTHKGRMGGTRGGGHVGGKGSIPRYLVKTMKRSSKEMAKVRDNTSFINLPLCLY
jgi:hypothetical protein